MNKYVKDVRKAMRARAVGFLSELLTCRTQAEIKACCEAEKDEFEQRYPNPNTQAAYMTQYRKAISAWQQDIELTPENSYEQPTQDGLIRQHLALMYMNYPNEFHASRQTRTEERKQEQRRNLEPINHLDQYLTTINQLLNANDYRDLATGLVAATGRRIGEILSSAQMEQQSQFEVSFSGQLKTKGQQREAYPIYTLIESAQVIDGLLKLHRLPQIKQMRTWNLAQVDSGKNKTINRQVRKHFSNLINPPYGEKELSSKNLRAAYSAIAIYLFCPPNHSETLFIKERLGHTSDATASNYEDYQVTDSEGNPQTRGVWVSRLKEIVTPPTQKIIYPRIRMTQHTKEIIDNQDFLFYTDQVSRLEELVRLATIGKDYEEGRLGVKEIIKEVEVVKEIEIIKEIPVVESKSKTQETSTETLIEGLRNSTVEQIEDAIALVKAYNETCYSSKEKYAINQSVLEQLTGCRSDSIKKYRESDRGRLNIDDYNTLHGFGFHQNRGKKPITEVIQ
jgi:integrase